MEFTLLKKMPARSEWRKCGDAGAAYAVHSENINALLRNKIRLHCTFDHIADRDKTDIENACLHNPALKTDGLKQIVLHRQYDAEAYRYSYEAFDYLTEPSIPERQILAVKVAKQEKSKSKNSLFPVYKLMKSEANAVSGAKDDGKGRYGLFIKLDESCVGRGKLIPSLGRDHVKRLLDGIVASMHRAGKTAAASGGAYAEDYEEFLTLRKRCGEYAFIGGDNDVWDGRAWSPRGDLFDHVELSVTKIIGDAMMLVTVSRM